MVQLRETSALGSLGQRSASTSRPVNLGKAARLRLSIENSDFCPFETKMLLIYRQQF